MKIMSADNKLLEIALRVREMREISGFSIEEMAQKTDKSVEEYLVYESGTKPRAPFPQKACRAILGKI